MPEYIIYADGACSGNPGPGGCAWELHQVIEGGELLIARGGGKSYATTNNIMELNGTWDALAELVVRIGTLEPGLVRLKLDSEYVLKGIFEWMPNWKRNNWRTASKRPVKNQSIWQEIDILLTGLRKHGFEFEASWVRGHAGDPGNERVDAKAVEYRDQARRV